MAHESFEDEAAAGVLNNGFVCVKVDREERPDIDSVYMSVCQAMTGSGGWPLTIIMTPDRKPFFAGTYLPKNSRGRSLGLVELLGEVSRQWDTDRQALTNVGGEVEAYLNSRKQNGASGAVSAETLIEDAVSYYGKSYDKRYGGFGGAPKFPTPHNLGFLLRYSALGGGQNLTRMVTHTLDCMYRGGIFDHIGGGFSRYSTDGAWLVPHFEKMLYDNALLIGVYAEAYAVTGRGLYRTAAARTADYCLLELCDPEGGFLSSRDADSDGVEGKYYVFTPEEIQGVLGEDDGKLFCGHYGIRGDGNFEGKSIPNLIGNSRFEAEDEKMPLLRLQLDKYRKKRTALHTDDKVLTSWNGLMIAGLAKAARYLDAEPYLKAAERAAEFIRGRLKTEDGRLMVRWRDGEAGINGMLDDYAFYACGLLTLYETCFETAYLRECLEITEKMIELFYDGTEGGFYMYALDGEQLIARPKEVYDGALPSGNSVAAYVLGRLVKLTGSPELMSVHEGQLQFISGAAAAFPAGHAFSLTALMESIYPSKELICTTAGHGVPSELREFLGGFAANLNVIVKTPDNAEELSSLIPYTVEYPIPASGEVWYLCQNGACSLPVRDFNELTSHLHP